MRVLYQTLAQFQRNQVKVTQNGKMQLLKKNRAIDNNYYGVTPPLDRRQIVEKTAQITQR